MSSDHPVRDCCEEWCRSEEVEDAMMGGKCFIVLEGKECLGLGLGPAARAGRAGPGLDHNVLEGLYVFPTESCSWRTVFTATF